HRQPYVDERYHQISLLLQTFSNSFKFVQQRVCDRTRRWLHQHSLDVAFVEDDQLFAVDFNRVATGIFAEHHHVTHFHVQRTQFTAGQYAAVTYGKNFALVWLFFSRTWQHDTTRGFFLFFSAANHNTVM